MSDLIRQLAPSILAEIEKSHHILFHCHPSPDGDSVGGVLGMKHALTKLGKQVTVIIGDSEPPESLSMLPGFSEIERKNWFDLNLSDYDLFISQDSSSPDQISKKAKVEFPTTMKVVVIDHHVTNTNYGHINLVLPDYPAVCQIVYELLKEWNLEITPPAAVCLFFGLYTDTGGFKYPATSPETLLVAHELAKINPGFPAIIDEYENSNEPERIKFIGVCLTHIETYFSNTVAISAVPFALLRESNIQDKHTEKTDVANILRSVKGWDVGIRFAEIPEGVVIVSMRSRHPEKFDVGKVCSATGFGGGHKVAAGATLKMPFDQAKQFLLDTIQKVYPELGQP